MHKLLDFMYLKDQEGKEMASGEHVFLGPVSAVEKKTMQSGQQVPKCGLPR